MCGAWPDLGGRTVEGYDSDVLERLQGSPFLLSPPQDNVRNETLRKSHHVVFLSDSGACIYNKSAKAQPAFAQVRAHVAEWGAHDLHRGEGRLLP